MKTPIQPSVLLLPVLLALVACPAQPIPNPTGDDPGPSRYDTAERVAAMDRVELEYERLLAANPTTAITDLASFVRAQPEFASAGTGDGTVLARFNDGRGFLFLDNFKSNAKGPSSQAARGVQTTLAPVTPTATSLTPAAAASVLPANNRALLMRQDIEDTAANDSGMNKIQKSLEKRGFVVDRRNTITVENLKTANEPSVLYIHAHGAEWYWDNEKEMTEYSIMTDTLISKDNDKQYQDDLKMGRLVYTRVRARRQDPNETTQGRYAVTGRFFAKYVKLAPRALVYMNACNSAETQAALFRLSLGSGVYIGYDGGTTDFGYEPAAYFFDRLLGGNVAEPPKPHGRVFTLDEVWKAMPKRRHGQQPNVDYLTDPVNGSKLTRFGNGLKLLVPNIKSLRFPGQDHMVIVTDVPADEPDLQVKIGGKTVSHQPDPDGIRVQLDTSMQGDVTLEVRGLTSNARPITSWRVPVTFKAWMAPGSGESANLTVNFDLHLRADAYEVRDEVDGVLREEGNAYYAAMDSQARYAFGGTVGPASYVGSGNLRYHFTSGVDTFSSTGYVHTLQRRMRLSPLVCCLQGQIITPYGAQDIQAGQGAAFEFNDLANPQPGREIVLAGWFMDLEPDLSIRARTVSNTLAGVEMSTISWPKAAASPAYRDTVER
jgi:hypothetical protein